VDQGKQSGPLYEGHPPRTHVRILQLRSRTPQEIRYFSAKSGLTEYKSINILDNAIIREEVKLYKNWPTYPQLYIDGELIGGSNILHEMHKDQSLEKLLSDKNLI
jgi:glutaredoxin-related protein